MNKVLVLVGPTAVGKTALSIELAKRYQGEIISGDSIQIYCGFDIGSAKIKAEEMQGIRHVGMDEYNPQDKTSVYDFQKNARNHITEINQRNKLPMIVGGTGFYIKAVLYDYVFSQQDEVDEGKLAELEAMSNEELHALLAKADPLAAKSIHPNNRKRVIRALMIEYSDGLSKTEQISQQNHECCYDAMILCCTMERSQLYKRIEQRVQQMMDDGLQHEIEQLLQEGVRFTDQAMQGIGYKEWQGFFEQTKTKEEVIHDIIKHSKNFAKRQMTWFNHQFKVEMIDVLEEGWKEKLLEKVDAWMVK